MGCEVPIVAKGMLENILASEGGGGISFGAADWMRNAYHAMPPPHLFSAIKLQSVPLLQTNYPGTSGNMFSLAPFPLSNSVPFSASHGTFMNGGGLGAVPVQKNEDNLPSPNNLETKKKKRNRNRGNGSSRKKTKKESCTDIVLNHGDFADKKLPSNRSRKRISSADKSEKTPAKRQSCKGIKEPGNDAERTEVSLNEYFFKDTAVQGIPNSGSNGILDIYGLKTMPINLSNRIVDISVNDLLSENFHPPQSGQLGNEAKQCAVDSSLVKEISKIVQLMPKPIHTEHTKLKMEDSSSLGLRSKLQEYGRGPHCATQQQDTCAMDASEEPSTTKFTASSHSAFPKVMFPLYPLQDFVNRLELPANGPLENLLVKPDRQLDTRIDEKSYMNKTDNIPPRQHSTPLTGGSKFPLKRDKESKKGSLWLRAGTVKCVNGSFGLESRLGLGVKSNANVKCELKEMEWESKDTRSEAKRAIMIDLNVQSSEQLQESSMVGASNSPLHNTVSEGRQGEETMGDCTENVCYSRVDHSITEDEKRSMCSKKESDTKKLPESHLETFRSQTANIQDVKNDIGILSKLNTVEVHETLKNPSRGEDLEDHRQKLRNFEEVHDKNTFQMDEGPQPLPSDLPALQLDLDKGMPNSPRVEAAARILLDMANSQTHDNGVSADNPQEYSCLIPPQESPKSSTIVHRSVKEKTLSKGDFKAVKEFRDAENKAPTNEKRKSRRPNSILLVKKYSSMGAEQEILPNQFQNRTFDPALTNDNTKQGLRDVAKQDNAESKEASDTHLHGSSSVPSKRIREDVGLKHVLCPTTNQSRGNLDPKSLPGGKMLICTKSNQNTRTNNATHKFTLSSGQNQRKVASVGIVKSSRPILSFKDRKR